MKPKPETANPKFSKRVLSMQRKKIVHLGSAPGEQRFKGNNNSKPKEKKKVKFDIGVKLNTDPKEESVEKDTPIRPNNEQFEIPIDDQLQSFRVTPRENAPKIITGGGQICKEPLIRSEHDPMSNKAGASISLHHGKPHPFFYNSLEDIRRQQEIEFQAQMASEESKEDLHSNISSNNIKVALASIIKQESQPNPLSSNVGKSEPSNGVQLTKKEEEFLEKKILEILDRNKRGEGYVQQLQKRRMQRNWRVSDSNTK